MTSPKTFSLDGSAVHELRANLVRRSCIGDLATRGAEHFGNRTALVNDGRTVTYRELDAYSNSVARGLLSAGLRRGDRLAVLAPNSWQFVVTYFACAKTGITFLPVNLALSAEEIAFQLADSSVGTVVASPDNLTKVNLAISLKSLVIQTITIGGNRSAEHDLGSWESLLERDCAPIEAIVEDADILHCLYTSGTTSNPKGVLTSHNSVLIAVLSTAIQMRHQRDTSGSVMPIVLPMFHVTALDALLLPIVATGGTAVLYSVFDPNVIADAIEKFEVTHLVLLPSMWEALLTNVNERGTATKSLRVGLYAMSPMARERVDAVREAFPNADIVLASGQTETTPASEIQWPGHQRSKHGAWGTPTLTTDVRIMNSNGDLLDRGMEGEIVYRTPQLMTEYANNADANNDAFAHGWFHSGDIGFIDDDGVVWFTDRLKDIVKSGGENVSSLEVEQVILTFPGVLECAVVGRAHARWGEAVTAIVVTEDGITVAESDIIEFCKVHLAGYKVPKQVIAVDTLPKTATGKIEKHRLRHS